jgi:rod shape-determining protein MreB
MGLLNFFVQDLAVDLGTANTVIIYNDEIAVEEPSIIAIDNQTKKLLLLDCKRCRCMVKHMRMFVPFDR